jgi:hypothetical protein
VHGGFHYIVLGNFLALDQALDQLVSAQELLDLVHVGLEVLEFLLRVEGFDRALRSAFPVDYDGVWRRGTTPDAPPRLRRL